MKILKHVILLFLSGLLIACGSNNAASTQQYSLTDAKWLIGAWQNSSPDGVLTENWKQLNDSLFAGESFFVVANDTLFSETIQLVQQGKELFYVPTVENQNGGLPIKFKLTSANGNQLVFENAAHDFPQKITYTLVNKDSLIAEISGLSKGEQKAERFAMGRVKS